MSWHPVLASAGVPLHQAGGLPRGPVQDRTGWSDAHCAVHSDCKTPSVSVGLCSARAELMRKALCADGFDSCSASLDCVKAVMYLSSNTSAQFNHFVAVARPDGAGRAAGIRRAAPLAVQSLRHAALHRRVGWVRQHASSLSSVMRFVLQLTPGLERNATQAPIHGSSSMTTHSRCGCLQVGRVRAGGRAEHPVADHPRAQCDCPTGASPYCDCHVVILPGRRSLPEHR